MDAICHGIGEAPHLAVVLRGGEVLFLQIGELIAQLHDASTIL